MQNLAEMKALYERVMGPSRDLDVATSFTLRVYDGSDCCWCDCLADVDRETALRAWCKETSNGTKRVRFHELDYYAIFPANTRMLNFFARDLDDLDDR